MKKNKKVKPIIKRIDFYGDNVCVIYQDVCPYNAERCGAGEDIRLHQCLEDEEDAG